MSYGQLMFIRSHHPSLKILRVGDIYNVTTRGGSRVWPALIQEARYRMPGPQSIPIWKLYR